ncbi:uncharacterized protein LOC130940207 [Arachis stenosperma]|uniref:uncharacterized protein LOC130940197 n=1 Tax=Arachis stenosperma TaxID=217475 RepID=UPI0025AC0442|nr:uncharacterized protein LOC130940197 [Arachis stenosperma]XP_057724253.1 uncharacterized protein LOC130940201 [Arachis stenosperma]XP_057724261.1 uncharacterized protein LOC130940207 [Arachis stenosperma]
MFKVDPQYQIILRKNCLNTKKFSVLKFQTQPKENAMKNSSLQIAVHEQEKANGCKSGVSGRRNPHRQRPRGASRAEKGSRKMMRTPINGRARPAFAVVNGGNDQQHGPIHLAMLGRIMVL